MSDLANDADKLVKIYRKMREAREKNTREWKKKDEQLKAQMTQVSNLLLKLMKERNVKGLQTENGTVSRTVKSKFWCVDWEGFKKWVAENNQLDLYEHRIAQKNMAEWLEKHPDNVPPGLQADRRYDVVVRKPHEQPNVEHEDLEDED